MYSAIRFYYVSFHATLVVCVILVSVGITHSKATKFPKARTTDSIRHGGSPDSAKIGDNDHRKGTSTVEDDLKTRRHHHHQGKRRIHHKRKQDDPISELKDMENPNFPPTPDDTNREGNRRGVRRHRPQRTDRSHKASNSIIPPSPPKEEEFNKKAGCGPNCGPGSDTYEDIVKEYRTQSVIEMVEKQFGSIPGSTVSDSDKQAPRLRLPDEFFEQPRQDSPSTGHRDESYLRDTSLVVSGEDLGHNCLHRRGTSGCYHFKIGRIDGDVLSANLWVHKHRDRQDGKPQTFSVYELEQQSNGRVRIKSRLHRLRSSVKRGWLSIPMAASVVAWQRTGRTNTTLAVQCVTCATRSHRSLYGAKHDFRPLISIKYKKAPPPTSHHRIHRRQATTTPEEACDPNFECCKRDLTINASVAWPLSIFPSDIKIDYCYGSCTSISQFGNHDYSQLKHRYSSGLRRNTTSQLMRQQLNFCCVPTEFLPIKIMFQEGLHVREEYLQHAIVKSCTCL